MTFQSEDAKHGSTNLRCSHSQTIIQQLPHLESTFLDLQVYSVNMGTVRVNSVEIVQILDHRSVDIFVYNKLDFS